MVNLTLSNPKLKNYLDGKSQAIPTDEFKAIFELKEQKGTFLETLDLELTKGTQHAISLGVRPREHFVSDQLLLVSSADIRRRQGRPAEDWVPIAAKSFQALWQHAKKMNALVQK